LPLARRRRCTSSSSARKARRLAAIKNKNLDGTIWGWMFMVGICLIAFVSLMWAVIGFAIGEFMRADTILAPTLVALGILTLLLRATTLLQQRIPLR
jgi:hypothetical protein